MAGPPPSPPPPPAGGGVTAELTFVGTATTLLRLGPFTVLTDPNFLHRGQLAWLGRGLVSRRRTEPALQVPDLPELDAVLLSHLHGDHWDRVAQAGLRALQPHVPVVTTPHAARRLARRDVPTVALSTWERHELAAPGHRLTIESLPAVHAHGLLGRVLPPVMGSLVTLHAGGHDVLRVYLTGDTLLGEHLDAITARHARPDVAVVHLGGTRILGALVTLDATGGVALLDRVQPRTAVPVHHSDYGVFRSPLTDFLDAWQRAPHPGTTLQLVAPGSTARLPVRA